MATSMQVREPPPRLQASTQYAALVCPHSQCVTLLLACCQLDAQTVYIMVVQGCHLLLLPLFAVLTCCLLLLLLLLCRPAPRQPAGVS
jgi:hypothetical protein